MNNFISDSQKIFYNFLSFVSFRINLSEEGKVNCLVIIVEKNILKPRDTNLSLSMKIKK